MFNLVLYKNRFIEYPFMHDENTIIGIEIVTVEVNGIDNNHIIDEKVYTIQNVDSFLLRFKEVTCKKNWYAPFGLHDNTNYVFKVKYNNGDYELIDSMGIAKFYIDRGMFNYCGEQIFDIEQFEKLLDYYLGDVS